MDYFVVLTARNFADIVNNLLREGRITRYDREEGSDVVCEIASGAHVALRRGEGDSGICKVTLESEREESKLALSQVLSLLNDNGIPVSASDILLYRKG